MKLFVYGTLKRGQRNHGLIRGQTLLGEFQTKPYYNLVSCGSYPALVAVYDGGNSIKGEVYEVDSETLSKLDQLEFRYGFDRVEVILKGIEDVQGYVLMELGTEWNG